MTTTRDRIREIFLANGFTIKVGQSDLKPYVYQAAEALLRAGAEALIKSAEATDPNPGTDPKRQKFETWARRTNVKLDTERDESGSYADYTLQAAWNGYQAGTEDIPTTPAARWRADNQPDPHGTDYNVERARLTLGYLTDDELANAVFMNYDVRPSIPDLLAGKAHSPIAYVTAAKERIRWLSRRLAEAEQAMQAVDPAALTLARAGHSAAEARELAINGRIAERDADKVIISWVAGDVQSLRPLWTLEQCAEALDDAEKHLRDRSIEHGWQVLDELLPIDPATGPATTQGEPA